MGNTIHQHNAQSYESQSGAKPQAILVLGMHRSGTSACVRVLNLLGCALSDKLLPAGYGNELGHWEPLETVTLNDEMLASAGSSYDDWGPINIDWRESAIRLQMVGRAADILAEHAQLGPLFAIKDPRMCRLADVWLEAAIKADVEPLVLLMLRNPAEVAASLEARDLMATGYSELLWLRYVLDAEFFSRGHKRVFALYDHLLTNWQSLVGRVKSGLGVRFPRNSRKVHGEIDRFLCDGQRHHYANSAAVVDNPRYSDLLRQTFGIMLEWSEQGEDPSHYEILDGLRAELDRAYSTFAPLLLLPSLAGGAGSGHQIRAELASLREEIEQKTEALQIATIAAEELRVVAERRESEIAAQVDAASSDTKALKSEIEVLRTELASSADNEAQLREQLDQRTAELASRADVEAQLREQLDQRTAELASRADVEAQLREQLDQRTTELARAEAAFEEASSEASAERKRRGEAEHNVAQSALELHDQQLRNAELEGQVSALRSSLVQRQEELGQLLSQLHKAERGGALAEAELEREREVRIKHELQVARVNTEIGGLQAELSEARLAAKEKVDALHADLAQLALLLQKQQEVTEEAERDRAESAEEVARLNDELRRFSEAVRTAEAARSETESKLAAGFNELARLASIVAVETSRADALDQQNEWLAEVRKLEDGFPAWWAILPPTWRQRRAHRRYLRAGLFDAEGYLTLYPDVSVAAMDPLRHYILHGMREGRTLTTPT